MIEVVTERYFPWPSGNVDRLQLEAAVNSDPHPERLRLFRRGRKRDVAAAAVPSGDSDGDNYSVGARIPIVRTHARDARIDAAGEGDG
jgi:hypothetical protein